MAILLRDRAALGVDGAIVAAAAPFLVGDLEGERVGFLTGERDTDRVRLTGDSPLVVVRWRVWDLAGDFEADWVTEAFALAASRVGLVGEALVPVLTIVLPPLRILLIHIPTAVVVISTAVPMTLGMGQACHGRPQSRGITIQLTQAPKRML